MFTQVLFLAGNHKKLSSIHATPSFVPDSNGDEQKIEKFFWKFVDAKNVIFQIHKFSILKKLWDLANENLEKFTGMWLNLYGCQLFERRPFYS